jgi:hypothetical protein
MASSELLTVDYGPLAGQVWVNTVASSQWLAEHGVVDQPGQMHIVFYDEAPTERHRVPQEVADAEIVIPTRTSYDFRSRRLDVFVPNVQLECERQTEGLTGAERKEAFSLVASKLLLQGLSETADYEAMGRDGVYAESVNEVKRYARKKSAWPAVGTVALAAASAGAEKFALDYDFIPGWVLAFGAVMTLGAAVGTYGAYQRSRARKSVENSAYSIWPFQRRARKRAVAYERAYKAGEAPLLMEFVEDW